MKNIFKTSMAVLIGLSLTLASCKKTETTSGGNTIPETFSTTKKALFLYYTGSQCNPCGSAGIPNYEAIVDDLNMKSKVVGVVVHTNAPAFDSLSDLTAGTAGGDLLSLIISGGSYSAPTFLVFPNAPSSGSAGTAKAQYTGYVNTFAAQAPVAAVNVSIKNVDGIYNVTTRTKFLKADNGTFKVSAWVVEDGIVFQQVKNGVLVRPYTHNDVLRGKFCTSTYGDDLTTGAVTEGQIVEKTLLGTIPFVNPTNPLKNWSKSNLSVVVVVWRHTVSGTTTVVEVLNCDRVALPL